VVEVECACLQELLKDWSPNDIFNADENGFSYRWVPTHRLSTSPFKGRKNSKACVTPMLTTNMTGTERSKLFIGMAAQPHCFKGKMGHEPDQNFNHYNNKKVWMTATIF